MPKATSLTLSDKIQFLSAKLAKAYWITHTTVIHPQNYFEGKHFKYSHVITEEQRFRKSFNTEKMYYIKKKNTSTKSVLKCNIVNSVELHINVRWKEKDTKYARWTLLQFKLWSQRFTKFVQQNTGLHTYYCPKNLESYKTILIFFKSICCF